jgi:serine/threonine protein kinase/Tol biopolymer transport system component
MALAPGTRLGPYELGSQIGAGGMGEVYRALDTRLQRSVAVKILPSALATDLELRDRFAREARVISSLNHPNICTLFDVGEAPADQRVVHFLVLELLDGETVAERLTRSGPLPVAEALKITADICSALDRAHRSGIVHRDLKPGNVFLVRGGGSGPPIAKLLDFGLAKGASPVAPAAGLSMPTTPAGLTVQGTILGTFQYMAPEQIEGLDADARSDIFALGATVFEMLTGRPAFDGKTRAALLGAILKDEPPAASSLRPGIPEHVDRVVATCLAKDPDDRWQSARDVLHALRLAPSVADRPATPERARPGTALARWAAAALLALAVAVGSFALGYRRSPPPTLPPLEFTIPAPADGSFDTRAAAGSGIAPQAAMSPDGSHLVFVATTSAGIQLWLRPMDSVEARPIAGTDEAAFPFWSPDSRSIGFFARGKLRRVSRDGGPVVDICPAPSGRGGSWNQDGVILFAPSPVGPLQRVSVSGGNSSDATALDETYGESGHRFPWFLPDGRHFLYSATVGTCCPPAKPAVVRIGVLDTREATPLLEAESVAMYTSGHVVYNRDGVVLARPFDAASGKFTGEPRPIADGVVSEGSRYASFSVSATGTLVHNAGSASLKQLTWFDRSGRTLGTVGEPAAYFSMALSADDSKVAAAITGAGAAETRRSLHVIAVPGGERRQVTFAPSPDNVVIWSPDGRQILFGGNRGGIPMVGLLTLATTEEERILEGKALEGVFMPSDWSRTGEIFFSRAQSASGLSDLLTVTLSDRTPKVYVQTPAVETNAAVSPDGKWVAYESRDAGMVRVVVRRFPATTEQHVVGTDLAAPLWSPDGRELFFVTETGDALMSVKVEQLEPFQFAQPRRLFMVKTAPPGGVSRHYAVSRDGTRFLVAVRLPAPAKPWVVTTNALSAPR